MNPKQVPPSKRSRSESDSDTATNSSSSDGESVTSTHPPSKKVKIITTNSSSDDEPVTRTAAAPSPSKKIKTTTTEIEIPKKAKNDEKCLEKNRLAEFRYQVKNIVVFHNNKEVEDILNSIADDAIDKIIKKSGFSWLIHILNVPRTEIKEALKKVVSENVQGPLKNLIMRRPRQAKQMVDLSNAFEGEQLLSTIEKTIEDEENIDSPYSFSSFMAELECVRYKIIEKIVSLVYSNDFLPSMSNMKIDMLKIKRIDMIRDICNIVFTTICPFARDFSKFFVCDEEGYKSDLDAILVEYISE